MYIGNVRGKMTTRVVQQRPFIMWAALLGVLTMLVMPAAAQEQVDRAAREKWDVEFSGVGDPADSGWTHHGNNYHSLYSRFTPSNFVPGWITATGNPGSYWSLPLPEVLTAAKGWTFEWAMQAANATAKPAVDRVIQLQDDVSQIQIGFDTSRNLVIVGDDRTNKSTTAPVKLFDGAGSERAILHVYRLVKQPGSESVELYVDNDFSKPAIRLALSNHARNARGGAITKLAESGFESAWDYWRAKAGTAIPEPSVQASVPHVLGSAEDIDGYRTYVIAPAINNEALLAGQPLPSVCRDETVMTVLCARGEREPASFVIETARALKQVMVNVGPLKDEAGGGVLPPEAVDVRIAQKFYRVITRGCVTMPWVLVHDPQMLKIVDRHPKWITEIQKETWKEPGGLSFEKYQDGFSKINHLTKELIDAETLQPSDIEGFQQFWLTVHVPQDAQAGTYRGDVTITASGAGTTTLALEVKVPAFDLLPPPFVYGAYYPTMLERPDMTESERQKYNPITEQQYLAEARNMAQHGCTSPCIYQGPEQDQAGKVHFTQLSRIVDLRERAGMPKGGTLYLMDGAGMTIKEGALTQQEKQRNTEVARATVAWAKERGYSGAMFMGADEFTGDRLRAMRDSYESVRAGGSGIWVAGWADLVNHMSDVVANPIFAHPGAMGVDQYVQWQVDPLEWLAHPERYPNWDPQLLLAPEIQQLIKTAHKHANKIFTYFDPQGGQPFPEYHRRHRGLGLWKAGIDGTMTWAYIHIWTPTARPNHPRVEANGVPYDANSFVVRGPEGVLDTLAWEGYREGYDDARYLATLQDAIARAKSARKHGSLVAETQRWLESTGTDVNLDEWRREMARRTELLLDGVPQ